MAVLWGVGGTLDLILTGRPVDAREALAMGLANRVVPLGRARAEAEALAETIAAFPPRAILSDRQSAHDVHGLTLAAALRREFTVGRRWRAGSRAHAGSPPALAVTASSEGRRPAAMFNIVE